MITAFLMIGVQTDAVKGESGQGQPQCTAAPVPRLAVGIKGQLTPTTEGQAAVPVRLREAPGKSSPLVGQILPDGNFQVVSGPKCKDGLWWWQVVNGSLLGWLAEGDSSGYFVEPLNGFGPVSAATPSMSATSAVPPTLPPVVAPRPDKSFAPFTIGSIDSSANVPAYAIAPDFGNVMLTQPLSDSQLKLIQSNGFVVSPGNFQEFYAAYQAARSANDPLFITTDSLLDTANRVLSRLQSTTEEHALLPALRTLHEQLLVSCDTIYQQVKGSSWEDAARRTVAFVAVGARLADPEANVPAYAADLVNAEVANIRSANGVGTSAVFPNLPNGEDWTQYAPSGHYAASDSLQTYFRLLTYDGRMIFHLDNAEETQSALLLSLAVRAAKVNGKPGPTAWDDLYQTLAFFTGQSDTSTLSQYLALIDQVYGPNADSRVVQAKGIDAFTSIAVGQPRTRGISTVTSDTSDNFTQRQGLRLFGPPFAWDDYVFAQLTELNVGTTKQPRTLPMPLDVISALGSDRALQILDKQGALAYLNYPEQMNKVRVEIGALDDNDLTGTLDGAWLDIARALNQPAPAGYPGFMLNQPYLDRNLFSTLARYVQRKHDAPPGQQALAGPTASNQPSASPARNGTKGQPLLPRSPQNYVEPQPQVWARLAALAEMIRTGLASRGYLSSSNASVLQQLTDVARRLQADSVLELKGQPLPSDEQARLAAYGDDLESLLQAAQVSSSQPVIFDLATDPSQNRVLQIGTGSLTDEYVVVPLDGKLILAHGIADSYYELIRSGQQRFSDDSWEQALSSNKPPALPGWTFTFLAQDALDPSLLAAIQTYRSGLVRALWDSPIASYAQYAQLGSSASDADKYLASELVPLARAHQFEGRQLLGLNFRTIKSPDSHTLSLVVDETWHGELHNDGADESSDGPRIGERGPYSVEMTYTFTKDSSGHWSLDSVSQSGQTPGWTSTVQ